MNEVFANDLSAFFSDFAVSAVVGGEEISVVFDQEWQAVQLELGNIDGSKSAILGKSADVEDLASGDPVEIGGTTYRVAGSPQPDGTGMSRVILMRY